MTIQEFKSIALQNGVELSDEQCTLVERYRDDLKEWNSKVNLISRKDEDHILERHIFHSMSILTEVNIPAKARILDIGTGGGFPGIPLKIARPDLRMTLTDSIAKKMRLTEMFAEHTQLKGFSCYTTRVEGLIKHAEFRGRFHFIVARAVAPIHELIGWSTPLLRSDGFYVFLKGGNLAAEILEAKQRLKGINIVEVPLDIKGIPWFKEQEKKIVVCTYLQ